MGYHPAMATFASAFFTTTETTAIVDELKRWIERTYARVELAVFPPKESRVGTAVHGVR